MDIIASYYDILTAFDADRLRAILAPDLQFEGPIAGRARRRRGLRPGRRGVRRRRCAASRCSSRSGGGATAATLYDAELPGGTVRFAEFFTLADDCIQSLRLHYDATEYRAKLTPERQQRPPYFWPIAMWTARALRS